MNLKLLAGVQGGILSPSAEHIPGNVSCSRSKAAANEKHNSGKQLNVLCS